MPASLSYELKGWNRVRNGLRRLASDYREVTDDTIGDFAKGKRIAFKAHPYPPQSRKPQPFKTAKQRRWFFYALKAGLITVPYSRTGTLANSWRAVQTGWSHWLIENSAAHAALTIGKSGEQAKYHQGNWWQAGDIFQSDVPDLTKQLTKELVELVE